MTCLHLATPSFSPDTTISSLSTLAGGTLIRAPVSSISCLMVWLKGPQTNGWNALGTGSRSKASLAYNIKTIIRTHLRPDKQKYTLRLYKGKEET